jgi:hypothetical protein
MQQRLAPEHLSLQHAGRRELEPGRADAAKREHCAGEPERAGRHPDEHAGDRHHGTTYTAGYDAAGDMNCRAPTTQSTCAGAGPTGAQLGFNNEGELATWQSAPSSPTSTAAFLYDGHVRWRTLDLGLTFAFVEAEAPRVRCRRHGVGVARVPWARHGSVFTRTFEDTTAWLATQCSKTAVSGLMRIAWPTVGGIVGRVAEDRSRGRDRFQGLRRIGVVAASRLLRRSTSRTTDRPDRRRTRSGACRDAAG